MHSRLISLLLLTAGWLGLTCNGFAETTEAAPAGGSVLGLEPGARRLCNDDLGAILWGSDTQPTLSIGKSDIWDRRLPPLGRAPLTMAQIIEGARRGDPEIINGKAYYTAYNSYDFPCPKPSGQLILQWPFLEGGGTLDAKEDAHAIVLEAQHGAKRLNARLFVSAVRNVMVLEGQALGLAAKDVAVRLYRHRDTILPGGELHPTLGGGTSPKDFEPLPMPRTGQDGSIFWVAQDFPSDATFPQGFTTVLAARIEGPAPTMSCVEGQTGLGTPMRAAQEGRISHAETKRYTPINEAPGAAATATWPAWNGPFALYATVVTTQDAWQPLERARKLLEEAVRQGTPALWAEHEARLAAYEARPHARMWSKDNAKLLDQPWGGVPWQPRPAGYYGDIALCSVGSTKYCFQDSSPWHADFHFNELDAAGPCMLRQFDVLDSHLDMALHLLPMAQANAREVYGCRGAMYPLVHYPLKADTVIHSHMTWEQSMEITALLLKPFWLRFLYTWDLGFLRDKAYPALREGARFYADYLKPEADGLYHVFPTVSPEHRGITKNLELNKDSQSGITLIRYHLRASAQAAGLLGLDAAEAAQWIDIAEKMPPYPLSDSPEGSIFADVAGGKPIEFNIAVPLSAVFWGDDIGLDSDSDTLALAQRTLRQINVWKPHQGYLAKVRRRLGVYNADDGWSPENMLQSQSGVLWVFPCVPPDFEGGFENLGAQGGFVVAAQRHAAGLQWIRIDSLAGNPCVLAVAGQMAPLSVTDLADMQPVNAQQAGSRLQFDTKAGHAYRAEPAHP